MTTASVVTLFDTNKEQRKTFVADLLTRLYDGSISPIRAHYSIKCMEEIIKAITADHTYKTMVLDEVEKNGKKYEYHNAEFSVRETGVKYDWSKTNDPLIIQLLTQQRDLEERIKERQEFLKNVPASGFDMVVEDEVVRVYPPAKSSTTSVVVSLK